MSIEIQDYIADVKHACKNRKYARESCEHLLKYIKNLEKDVGETRIKNVRLETCLDVIDRQMCEIVKRMYT